MLMTTTQVNGKGKKSTPHHANTFNQKPQPFTKIVMCDYVMDIARHATNHIVPFLGVSAPIYVILPSSCLTSF